MKDVKLAELTSGYKATDSNVEMLFERCVTNSKIDQSAVYVAGCLDVLNFIETIDFSKSFKIDVDIQICPSKKPEERVFFHLQGLEFKTYLNGLTYFFCSNHSPLLPQFSSVLVPKIFGGWKREHCLYQRLANHLDKKNYRLILSGFLEFQKDPISEGISSAHLGSIRVLVNLPRVDYVSEYLSKIY